MLSGFALLALLPMASPAQESVFRFGWRQEASTSRSPENMDACRFDPFGNLFLAGTVPAADAQNDILVRKCSPMGELLWEIKFDCGDGKKSDAVMDSVVDAKGDLYLALNYPQNGYGNVVLAKISGETGKILFKKIHDSGNERAMATAMALDTNSNSIIIVGGIGKNARENAFIGKWSDTGTTLWTKTWSSPDKPDRQFRGVSVHSNGEITAVGYTTTNASNQDSLVTRFTANGTQKWSTSFAGTALGTDKASFAVHDSNGDSIVAGDEYVEGSRGYAYIARLDAGAGKVIWKTHLNDVRNNDGVPLGLFRVGSQFLLGVQTYPITANNVDLAVLKYDSSGKQLWKSLVNAAPGFAETGASFQVDSYGYSYISGGSTDSARDMKYFVGCVDPSGSLAWQYRDTVGNPLSLPAGLAIANDSGHVVLSGNRSRGIDDDVNQLCVYQAPRATNDFYSVFQGESIKRTADSGVRTNDVFHRFCQLELVEGPKSGTLKLEKDGSFEYAAAKDFEGSVTFSYRLTREGLKPSTGTATISVAKKPKP